VWGRIAGPRTSLPNPHPGGTVVSRSHGRRRAYFYGCLTSWKRGATICPNDLILPIEWVNDAVLKAIAGDVLRPAVVSAIIDGFLEQLLPSNVETASMTSAGT
jgi:hypothetical protein